MCLGYGGQYKKVLVSGGYGSSVGEILSDAWLLDPDPQSWRWEEVRMELFTYMYINMVARWIQLIPYKRLRLEK